MKQILFFALAISLASYGCQKRTHVYGFIGDENQKPIIGVKIALVRVNQKEPSKTDTLATAYSEENGFQLNIVSRKHYGNVQLINPYLINAGLRDKYKLSEPSKGGVVILDCCKILIGRPNQYGFLLRK